MLPWLVAASILVAPAASGSLVVEVIDVLGAPVMGARVVVRAGPVLREGRSDDRGRCVLDLAASPNATQAHVSVTAAGFGPAERQARLSDPIPVRIVLEPSRVETNIVVTATRDAGRGGRARAGTTVLRASDLATAPGFPLDDALRTTPGFSLFRRTSSRVANPTTQGVTLRGLTASGASRTLVLSDGVPLNDPFGGWVAWTRVPLAAIERVEIVRGGAGDLYGPDALGGVVQVFTGLPRAAVLRAVLDVGGQVTARASLGGTVRVAGAQTLLGGEAFTTKGYIPVAADERGPIDEPAGSTHRSVLARVSGTARAWSWRAGGYVFADERRNGTPLQRNSTAARLGDAQLTRPLLGGFWRAQGFYGTQGYDQSFSAATPDRASEQITQQQRVPSRVTGFSSDWAAGGRTRALFGIEMRAVEATNQETRFTGTPTPTRVDTGGRHAFWAGYAQVAANAGRSITLFGGIRAEHWTLSSFQDDPTRRRNLVSPRAGVAWDVNGVLSVRGNVSRAFRAPTLNERFRGFRAGNTVTRPNPDLGPERLTAVEGAVTLNLPRFLVRTTAFANRLSDPITNVTLSTTPATIVRERRNAGSVLADGFEIEADGRIGGRLQATLAGAFTRARFGDDAPEGLGGRRVPQSPRVQGSGEVRWADLPRISVSARVFLVSDQFEDDRNTLRLRPGATADVQVARQVLRQVLVLAAVENVFNTEIDVGRTPLRTVGSPRLLRLGCRVRLP